MLPFSFNNKRQGLLPNYGLTQRVMLFTNARDEKYIKEWAAHHLLVGFDIIYIFDHKSHFPLKNVFHGFDKRVIIENCALKNPVKIPLMYRATEIAKQFKADWFLYLDADEFLVINAFEGVKKMLNFYKNAHSVGVNWVMFGTNHQTKDPSGLIMEHYTKSDAHVNQHVKTFVRPFEVKQITNPHFYHIYNPEHMVSVDGKKMNKSNNLSFNKTQATYSQFPAYIAHYHYQSEESYVRRKTQRAQDDGTGIRQFDPQLHAYHNEVENTDLKNKYAENVKNFLQFTQMKN
jgi:hypothetical protein